MPAISQNKRRAVYRGLMIAALVAMASLTLLARLTGVSAHWAATAVALAVAVLAALEFAAFDELQKQNHYEAWYWGGMLGVGATGLLAAGLALDVVPFAAIEDFTAGLQGRADGETLFIMGLLTGPLLFAAGFVVWRFAHWLRVR